MSTLYPTKQTIMGQQGQAAWVRLLKERRQSGLKLSLLSKEKRPFWFQYIPVMIEWIAEIERERGFLTSLGVPKGYQRKIHQDQLDREAYYSSRIEGAVTSLEEALLNLRSKKQRYTDESMQMIYNNKKALHFIVKSRGQRITKQMISQLHRVLMENTHRHEPITIGDYRKGPVYVVSGLGEVVYEGPPAKQVRSMMKEFMAWLNDENELHPLLKAGIAHMYFVHIHPFDDGNGRSARALSNLILLNHGYEFINFVAPSDYFEHHLAAYYNAIRNVETHGDDLTYFLTYYLEALRAQLKVLKTQLQKQAKVTDLQDRLKQSIYVQLNKRQIKGLKFLVQNSEEALTTKKYCKLNRCSDETARKDFNQLLELKVLQTIGEGRARKYQLIA